ERADPNDPRGAGTIFDLDPAAYRKVFSLNYDGTLFPTLIFAADMAAARRGIILNISSMSAFRPLTKVPAYSSAKAAVNNFTAWLAVHLAPLGIRVNALAPGFLVTEQNRDLLTDPETGTPTARGEKILRQTPFGRFARPKELTGPALFLLSDLSAFVTGIVMPVDGGFNAYAGV
ncbi:MAG TPA: SDR family oxidoreductase, partial [Spirochaetia bacterium]|nr:SDR family oxidoreductase [Spirochaetia bacterium]